MGLILDHLQNLWVGTETTFGAGPAAVVAGANAIDHISLDASVPGKRVIPNLEQTGNRGPKNPFRGAQDPVSLRLQMYLKGSGTAATPPDYGDLFKAAGFTETIGASVVYSRTLAPTTSAWIWTAHRDGSMGRMYCGVVFTEVAMPDVGMDAARIDFAGNASHISTIYATTTSGSLTAVATSITLAADHGWVLNGAPAYAELSDGTNVECVKVTAISGNVITVTRNAAAAGAFTFASGSVIRAYYPSRTLASTTPIGETNGSFALNDAGGAGTTRIFMKAGLTIATGVDHLAKEAFSQNRNGMISTRYGETGARLTADFVYTNGAAGVNYLHSHFNNATNNPITLTVGSTAGNRCIVAFAQGQVIDLSAPDGADGPRNGTVIFGAYSADGADLTITFS